MKAYGLAHLGLSLLGLFSWAGQQTAALPSPSIRNTDHSTLLNNLTNIDLHVKRDTKPFELRVLCLGASIVEGFKSEPWGHNG